MVAAMEVIVLAMVDDDVIMMMTAVAAVAYNEVMIPRGTTSTPIIIIATAISTISFISIDA